MVYQGAVLIGVLPFRNNKLTCNTFHKISHIVTIKQYNILEAQNNTTAELMGFQALTVFVD